jgi:hypothetical protein
MIYYRILYNKKKRKLADKQPPAFFILLYIYIHIYPNSRIVNAYFVYGRGNHDMIGTNCLKMNIHNQIIQIDKRNGPNYILIYWHFHYLSSLSTLLLFIHSLLIVK